MSELFNIQHESDLSEYDSTVTDGGDLSQGSPGLASTAGRMECLIDDTTSIYGVKNFTQITSTSYRFRIYVDPNSISMPNSTGFDVCRITDSGSGRAAISLYYSSGGTRRITAYVKRDDSSYSNVQFDSDDAEHYVEVLVGYASSDVASDGTITMWVDGVQRAQNTGLDIYDISKPDTATLGPVGIPSSITGTLYLDELVLRDDDTEIGPVSALSFVPRVMIF